MSFEGWGNHFKAGNTCLNKLIMALLALALLLALRPYAGIRHDAVFYLGQGLLALYPEEFGKDLFFAYGSQASYTLFPRLLGGLMKYFPASELFAWLTLAGRVAFLLCSYLLLRKLFNGPLRYLALLTLLVLPAAYGSKFVFSYGEPFFTGRSLAEPLCLLSLAAFVSRRYFLAACLWLLAAVVHPLQALAVALVLWCWLCVDDRRWVWLAVPAVIVTALAYLIRGPSLFFFQQYDAQWLAWISGPNRNVFLKNWPVASWVSLGLDFLLVLLARHFVLGRVREFYTALLIALIVGFVASLVLVDWLSLVLPTGLQLWRVQWISHWGGDGCDSAGYVAGATAGLWS